MRPRTSRALRLWTKARDLWRPGHRGSARARVSCRVHQLQRGRCVSVSLAATTRIKAVRNAPAPGSPDFAELGDWLCVGRSCWRSPLARRVVAGGLGLVRGVLPARTRLQRWIRYGVDLAGTPAAPAGVRLTLMTDEIIALVAAHPDRAAHQV